ncbi:4982_t:CDS:1, partial [Acaulospora morrowiae]
MSSFRFARTFSSRANVQRASAFFLGSTAVMVPLRNRVIPTLPRTYSTATPEKKGGNGMLLLIGAALIGGGAGYYFYANDTAKVTEKDEKVVKKGLDYQSVYNQIADILEDNDYDDGS